MKITKRDFLKALGAGTGGVVIASGAKIRTPDGEIVKVEPDIVEPPVPEPVPVIADPVGRARSMDPFPMPDWWLMDVRYTVLFDRIQLRAGQSFPNTVRMFQTPVGGVCPYTGRVKGVGDTNMWVPGQLPAPCWFLVRRIHVLINPDIGAEDLRWVRGVGWRFQLLNKVMDTGVMALDGRLGEWRPPELDDLAMTTPVSTRETRVYPVDQSTLIPSQAYFGVDLETECHTVQDAAGVDIMLVFEGYHARGIQ